MQRAVGAGFLAGGFRLGHLKFLSERRAADPWPVAVQHEQYGAASRGRQDLIVQRNIVARRLFQAPGCARRKFARILANSCFTSVFSCAPCRNLVFLRKVGLLRLGL
jgi:hypothetical protein